MKKDNKLRLIVLLAGFISMELEILGTRLISPIFGSTIYVWTSLIGITLTFLALGYWYGGKLADKGKITLNTLGIIILALGIYICLLPYISRFVLYNFSHDLGIIFGPLLTSLIILAFPIFFLGFVVPTSVKLTTDSLKEVGSRAGEIYALATLGSIIGTFVTGFYLILYFGVIKTALITGIILILLSLLIIKHKAKFFSLIFILLLLFIPNTYASEIVESFDSYYGRIVVRDIADRYTYLYIDGVSQSIIHKDTKKSAMFNTFLFNVPFVYDSNYKKVLIVGFAGGVGAKELTEKYDINLDIVEIEPKMLDIARKYFYWNDQGKIYFDDARHFITNAEKYDVIIIDIGIAFSCWHLYTLEAMQEYEKHLNDNGMLLIILNGALEGEYSKAAWSEYKTLKSVFKDVLILRNPNIKPIHVSSVTFIASKKEIDKSRLLERAANSDLSMEGLLPLERIVSESLKMKIKPIAEAKISTDDHPIIEIYDYIVWQKLSRTGKDALKYFLP